MRYVVNNNINNIISDNSYYVSSDGTQYSPEYPKSGLPGLSEIINTPPPDYNIDTQVISDSVELINKVYSQIWTIRDLTQAELDAKKPPVVPLTNLEFIRRFTKRHQAGCIRVAAAPAWLLQGCSCTMA